MINPICSLFSINKFCRILIRNVFNIISCFYRNAMKGKPDYSTAWRTNIDDAPPLSPSLPSSLSPRELIRKTSADPYYEYANNPQSGMSVSGIPAALLLLIGR